MLLLTNTSNCPTVVNPSFIVKLERFINGHGDEFTEIKFSNGTRLRVKETPEDIFKLTSGDK